VFAVGASTFLLNRFVRAGIVHLKQAIKFGEKGDAKGGVKHAKEALAKLDHAPH
jgi:hypothetical protein